MKSIFVALFMLVGFTSFSQEDSTTIVNDTLDIYVINSTNRLIHTNTSFAIEYRDLKSLRDVRTIRFASEKEVDRFFANCFRAMEADVNIVSEHYTVNRNKLNKNLVRVHEKDGAYFLMSYDTVQKMQTAFERLK